MSIYEVLCALAAIATVIEFILERWEKHKRRRMEAEEKEKTGGHRS